MRVPFFDRIQSVSLKWKIVIPFLVFSFTGTTVLTCIGLSSQQTLIRSEEEREIAKRYHLFLEELQDKEGFVLSLAAMISEDPTVQRFLAERDRESLYRHTIATYTRLRKDFNVEQIHFHIPPGISFLRLHRPRLFGDDLTRSRKSITDVMRERAPKGGIELGRSGYGIRGVVPVFYKGQLAGSVEAGYSFGPPLLLGFQKLWGMDISLYAVGEEGEWKPFAGTPVQSGTISLDKALMAEAMKHHVFQIEPERERHALLMGPVKDYSGRVVAILRLSMDRSVTRKRLAETRNIMIVVGVAGIAISFLLTYVVAALLIRPLAKLVSEAQEIAEEKRDHHIAPPGWKDEIGTLTEALNLMLDALQEKRAELERHARTLERRVEERTLALVESEEKYRTLVEHVPLIVYRILPDGTTAFVNSYLTKSLGYSTEEAVRDKQFWFEKVWGCRGDPEETRRNFESGEGYRVERTVRDIHGRELTFIDHSIPARDPNGVVRWVDGIMLDISELKSFQEMVLRTEEIRLLEEISAHMAHAIRNPLSSAGGFARRLQNGLPGNDPNRRLAEIIVKEVVRIEDFLKVLFSSIRPFELSLGEVDINKVLESVLGRLEGALRAREISVDRAFSPDLPKVQGDEERLGEALENILKHASILAPSKEHLSLSTKRAGDRILITLAHRTHPPISKDDLDKFFFPHIEEKTLWPIIDLSLSRRIIHRHGGKIDVHKEENECLVMGMELPVRMGR